MSAADVLLALVDAGVVLWVEGDRLRYRAPVGALTAELRDAVAARPPAVIALVKAGAVLPASIVAWPDEVRFQAEERAGILQLEGGLVREVAEREAERLVRLERVLVARNALVVQPQAAAVAGERPGGGPHRRP